MLLELTIRDFAIIDRLRLPLGAHLNVFTGETGAGKSIIVDAISALVGERVGSDSVRSVAERAIIEGVFDVGNLLAPAEAAAPRDDTEAETLAGALGDLGIAAEDGLLILAREIARGGRGIARVNGRAVPISTLQRLARFLIDIHGQSAHLMLLRPEQHLYYLDRYAGTEELRGEVARLVARWRAVRREVERLRHDEREAERRGELLRYQIEEIGTARLRPGELEELERERRVLVNAERLTALCGAIHAALAGDETGETPGALDALAQAQRPFVELLRLDDSLHEQLPELEQALFLAEDVAAAVRSYQDEIAADPARQAEVEERLDLLARLRRKYGTTIEEVLAFAAEAARELDALTHREERAADLLAEEQQLRAHIGANAGRLSALRRAAAGSLTAAMERELDDLNMQRARFGARIEAQLAEDGVPVPTPGEGTPRHYAFTASGIDQIEFLIAPNPGEPLKPLARIASGGETSRLMLALKTILSRADAVPILIFDEIDAGISGRSGQVVGEKLWQLAREHQVLCVTHLPQIAALGDDHYHVSKVVADERTSTHVVPLSDEARTDEVAHMLGGARTPAARANAAELLERASTWKRTPGDAPLPAPSSA